MKLRLSELLEREVKLIPSDEGGLTESQIVSLFAQNGIDLVEDDHSLQERHYWDGFRKPFAHKNITCLFEPCAPTSYIEFKLPLSSGADLYREFTLRSDQPIEDEVLRDPIFWNAPGLSQIRATFEHRENFQDMLQSLKSTVSSRTRRTYYWITTDERCKKGDYFLHDTVLVFDRVHGFVGERQAVNYNEIEIEVCPWAPESTTLAKRAGELLCQDGYTKSPISKYRRICQLANLI
ncbi:hypothetical protein LJR231_002782 [Phyllobacterium sp. LjRoot231]|uniref:hypothetical protein n=1 Tax=Phyllobacterium sp. LjRoot231 TaxID=3342289 RepID=UPI003ECCB6C6